MKNFLPNFMFCAQTLRNIDRCSDGKTKNAKTRQVNKLMFVTFSYDNKSPV